MFPFADIGGWQMLQYLLSTLPEITLWAVLVGGLGLIVGIALLMASLRWLLPWAPLHQLRQGRRGWVWMTAQWTWVILWVVSLPALCMTTGALTGGALGARTLVHREHLGQLVGERLLHPIGRQIALQLQIVHPDWGDLTTAQLDTNQIQTLLEDITPGLLNSALQGVPILQGSSRRFARQAIERAAQSYFAQKIKFATALTHQLPGKASLKEVVCCASLLYFTPAFAQWTSWWVLAQAAATLPLLALVWVTPWASFQIYWWRQRKAVPCEIPDGIPGI